MAEQVNLLQPTASKLKATTSIFPLSTSPLAQTHYPIYFLTSLQLWVVPPTRIRQASWHHRSQWCRKVNSPPAYRYARGSYTRTHFHPLCETGSTVYFIAILLPCLESTNVQIVGDVTSGLGSVLKADVWQDHLLSEEVRLNVRLAELDATPPGESDARLEEMRGGVTGVSGHLAEVHASVVDRGHGRGNLVAREGRGTSSW